MKPLKLTSLAILIVLVGIQFVPTRSNISLDIPPSDFVTTYRVPHEIEEVLHTSCYDCHSNNTSYPWYNRIQPISWLLENHINKGKAELNLSEFGSYSNRKQKSKLTSMINQIDKGEMPLPSYTLIHRNARLSKEKKEMLLNYLNTILENL